MAEIKNPDINARVKEFRLYLGLKQNDFAEKIGIKQSSLSSIENISVNVSDRVIKDICLSFNASETWLRTGNGDKIEPLTRSEELALWAGKLAQKSDDNFAKRFALMLSQFDESEWKFIEMKLFSLFEDRKNNKD